MNAPHQQMTAIPMVTAPILMGHSIVRVTTDILEMEHYVQVLAYHFDKFITVMLISFESSSVIMFSC